MSPDNRRRLGEGIALILYFIIDAYEVWPQSHSIALLAAVLGASAVLFAEWSLRPWMISTITLCVLAGTTYLIVGPALPPETDIHGWFLPANDPTPPFHMECVRPGEDGMSIFIGNNLFFTQRTGHINLFRIDGCPPISLDRSEDGTAITADIYASDGKTLAARVEKNEWQVVPGEISYIKRPDRSTLTVFDKEGNEMLWVRFLNSKTMRLRGVFTCLADGVSLQRWIASDGGVALEGARPGTGHFDASCVHGLPPGGFKLTYETERRLRPGQIAKLKAELSGIGFRINVMTVGDDPEIGFFAEDFLGAFREAGVLGSVVRGASILDSQGRPTLPDGVVITGDPSPEKTRVEAAFVAAEIPYTRQDSGVPQDTRIAGIGGGSLSVIIGRKPRAK